MADSDQVNPLVCVVCHLYNAPINILECFHVICEDCHLKKKGKLFLLLCPSCSQITSLPIKDKLRELAEQLTRKSGIPEEMTAPLESNLTKLCEEIAKIGTEKSELEKKLDYSKSSYESKLVNINSEFDKKLKILETERDSQIQALEKEHKADKDKLNKQFESVSKSLTKCEQQKAFLQICSERLTEEEFSRYKEILNLPKPPQQQNIASISVKSLEPDSPKLLTDSKLHVTQSLPLIKRERSPSRIKPVSRYKRNFALCKDPAFCFGKYGSGNSEFRGLKAVAISPDDIIIYALDLNQVKAFDNKGSFLFQFSSFPVKRSQIPDLTAIAADQCCIYVSDVNLDIIHVLSLSYSLPSDNYPSEAEFKCSIGNSGPSVQRLSKPGPMMYSAFKSNLFVADNGNKRIALYNAGYQYVCQVGKGQIEQVCSLAVSLDGELVYALERAKTSKCVRIFNSSGELIKELGMRHSELKHPWSLCTSDEGQVMVTDGSPDYGTLGHSVRVFSKEGKLLGKVGCSGKIPGQFKDPRGLVIDGKGKMIVIDSGNHRLQIF